MSTKALRTVVGLMGCSGVPEKCLHCGATRELEAIEKAAKEYAHVDGYDVGAVHDLLMSIAKEAP